MYSSNNGIVGNNITNNDYGIALVDSSDNSIYHNNIIDNARQVYDYSWDYPEILPSISTWDDGYPSGGNYWSDYTGVDANGDGIGDTLYVIDVDNQDCYPLMHPWSSLPVHNINTGLGYATIQEAINAAETVNGHTIFVEAGIYYEHTVVNKTVSLVGENRERTIIDGSRIGNVVHVVANNTFISNFSIQNGGPTYFGIRFDHSSHNKLINSNIINNYGSIDLFYSSNNTLSNNAVTSNYDGIQLSDAFNNTISDNNIASNFNYGIHLWHSFDNVVFGNNVTNNYWYGIYLGNSSNNTFSSNTVASNGEDGIRLELSSNYNIMLGNTIRNNKGGIWLSPSCNNIISGNNITTNKFGGIYLYYSSNNNSINGNNIVNNDFGVLVYYSLSNAINGNNITANNRYGVALYSFSKNNSINGNDITNNANGIFLENSLQNFIYHNNFVDNAQQAYTYYSSNNVWDDGYPSGGNYWSDYVGVDVKSGPNQDLPGSDSIGDTPYVIDENNTDYYPLMNPWSAVAGNLQILKPTNESVIMGPVNITFTIENRGCDVEFARGDSSNRIDLEIEYRSTGGELYGWGITFWSTSYDGLVLHSGDKCAQTVFYDPSEFEKAVPPDFIGDAPYGKATIRLVHWKRMDEGYGYGEFGVTEINVILIPPPLSASIIPLSASINVGQSATFTSTVSGGYTPYNYQWYLNGNPVSGATSNTWIFTPTTSGIYYIHLKVTDAKDNTTQSETARTTVAAVPVGGYSIPVERSTKAYPLTPYLTFAVISAIIFTAIKRKVARKTKSSPKSFS